MECWRHMAAPLVMLSLLCTLGEPWARAAKASSSIEMPVEIDAAGAGEDAALKHCARAAANRQSEFERA